MPYLPLHSRKQTEVAEKGNGSVGKRSLCPYSSLESQNGLGWKGPQGSCISNPPARQGHQPPHLLDQVAPSNLALNTSRDGAPQDPSTFVSIITCA